MHEHEPILRAFGWARKFPVTGGVRNGRAWARQHLDELGWTEHAPETADAVVLIISELITNAHLHAVSDADLVLTWDGKCLYVSVHDDSPTAPRPREAAADATSGRGMALIDALADDWQTRTGRSGKTVTACFHPPTGPDG
ncbi:hypothetical protein KCMC57_up04270 [Kitasatospora sp. CMC57]|uniref:Histidine kinase/HSP90-like ATPase domain-containing protein n=1 Tax=Kitasatospora sp. CMC57 TaxID=3231513 RepID=A0AB33JXH4_9ACTN